MPTNVDDIVGKLRRDQRREVEDRAAHLIAEETTVRGLRHGRKVAQVRMEKKLGKKHKLTGAGYRCYDYTHEKDNP